MTFGHPLAYPVATATAPLLLCVGWAPFADDDQLAALAAACATVFVITGVQLAFALRRVSPGPIRRVRQQHRLVSRSWLEAEDGTWTPVFFDPVLVTMPTPADGADYQLYRCGPSRRSEPRGRLIDNPAAPDPAAADRAARASRWRRRALLDVQSAVAAPVIGAFWVYLDGGGIGGFVAATTVAAAGALWWSAIRGSDPS